MITFCHCVFKNKVILCHFNRLDWSLLVKLNVYLEIHTTLLIFMFHKHVDLDASGWRCRKWNTCRKINDNCETWKPRVSEYIFCIVLATASCPIVQDSSIVYFHTRASWNSGDPRQIEFHVHFARRWGGPQIQNTKTTFSRFRGTKWCRASRNRWHLRENKSRKARRIYDTFRGASHLQDTSFSRRVTPEEERPESKGPDPENATFVPVVNNDEVKLRGTWIIY